MGLKFINEDVKESKIFNIQSVSKLCAKIKIAHYKVRTGV